MEAMRPAQAVWIGACQILSAVFPGTSRSMSTIAKSHESTLAVTAIEAAFPGTAAGGTVDRAKLAARVLQDPAALQQLEQIVHPLVQKAEQQLLTQAQTEGANVVVLDIPLLFETGGERRVDAVVVVSAPYEVQKARLLERPGMTEEKFSAISAKQMPDAEKRRRADFIVDSSGDFDRTRAQVRDILRAVAKMQPDRQ